MTMNNYVLIFIAKDLIAQITNYSSKGRVDRETKPVILFVWLRWVSLSLYPPYVCCCGNDFIENVSFLINFNLITLLI
jgi:hypothetical protein